MTATRIADATFPGELFDEARAVLAELEQLQPVLSQLLARATDVAAKVNSIAVDAMDADPSNEEYDDILYEKTPIGALADFCSDIGALCKLGGLAF